MNRWWLICIVVIVTASPAWSAPIEQNCTDDDCVQIGKNVGTINLEGRQLQIGINEGVVNVLRSEEDRVAINNYSIKVTNLEKQITLHLQTLQAKETRIFSDAEKLQTAAVYTDNLLKQIDQLTQRIALLDVQQELTQRIEEAKDRYDVPLIKALLEEKQALDDKQAAETAFELAGFQELDLEYQEAYENYQKAVFLQKDNTLYLNDAGVLVPV